MIKKSTLIVLLCAALLIGGVYFFQWRSSKTEKPPEDTSRLAFSVQGGDITALTIERPGKTDQPALQLVNRNGNWDIMRPLDTSADSSAVKGITDGLASARISQTESGTADRLKAYGLDSPKVKLDFQIKSGAKHRVVMGDKDFTGSSVYAIIDGAQTVSLLPASLLDSTDKSVDDLRDKNVLHIDSGKVASFELKNSSGDLAASKQTMKDQAQWNFTKPFGVRADTDSVTSLFSALANGKYTKVENENAENLGKYGLANPATTFMTVDEAGHKQSLQVGKKEGDGYLARDGSRPTIFVINSDLYKKLTQTFYDLRDKNLAHVTEDDVSRIELHDTNATMAMARKPGSDFDWLLESPADVKGKTAAVWKIFSPLSAAKAEEIIDHPSADIAAKLSKPALQIDLTEKSGTKLTIKISSASGDFVYGQTSASPSVYKLKKSVLSDLDFKTSDLAS